MKKNLLLISILLFAISVSTTCSSVKAIDPFTGLSSEVVQPYYTNVLNSHYLPKLEGFTQQFKDYKVVILADTYTSEGYIDPQSFDKSAFSEKRVVKSKPLPKDEKSVNVNDKKNREDCSAYINFKSQKARKLYEEWGSKLFVKTLLWDNVVNNLFCQPSNNFVEKVKAATTPMDKMIEFEEQSKTGKTELGEQQRFVFRIKNISTVPIQNLMVLVFLPDALEVTGEPQTTEKQISKKNIRRERKKKSEGIWETTILDNDDEQKIVVYFAEFSMKPGHETQLYYNTLKIK